MIALIESHFPEMPNNITIVQDYGHESIHCDGEFIHGESRLLSGEPDAFKAWLGGLEVWSTNNPLMGVWRLGTIKQE
jgi:hypothetical protein